MSKIKFFIRCGLIVSLVLVLSVSMPIYSLVECIGLSDCDFNTWQACLNLSEYEDEEIVWSICTYQTCNTKYRVHCFDMDAEEPYTRTLYCNYWSPFGCIPGDDAPE